MVSATAALVLSCGAFGAGGDDDDDAPAPAPAPVDSGKVGPDSGPATNDDAATMTVDAGPDAQDGAPAKCDSVLVRDLKPSEGDKCLPGNAGSVPASNEAAGSHLVNVGKGICGSVGPGQTDSFQVLLSVGECIAFEFFPGNDKATMAVTNSIGSTLPPQSAYVAGARRVVVNTLVSLTLNITITSPAATTYTLAVF